MRLAVDELSPIATQTITTLSAWEKLLVDNPHYRRYLDGTALQSDLQPLIDSLHNQWQLREETKIVLLVSQNLRYKGPSHQTSLSSTTSRQDAEPTHAVAASGPDKTTVRLPFHKESSNPPTKCLTPPDMRLLPTNPRSTTTSPTSWNIIVARNGDRIAKTDTATGANRCHANGNTDKHSPARTTADSTPLKRESRRAKSPSSSEKTKTPPTNQERAMPQQRPSVALTGTELELSNRYSAFATHSDLFSVGNDIPIPRHGLIGGARPREFDSFPFYGPQQAHCQHHNKCSEPRYITCCNTYWCRAHYVGHVKNSHCHKCGSTTDVAMCSCKQMLCLNHLFHDCCNITPYEQAASLQEISSSKATTQKVEMETHGIAEANRRLEIENSYLPRSKEEELQGSALQNEVLALSRTREQVNTQQLVEKHATEFPLASHNAVLKLKAEARQLDDQYSRQRVINLARRALEFQVRDADTFSRKANRLIREELERYSMTDEERSQEAELLIRIVSAQGPNERAYHATIDPHKGILRRLMFGPTTAWLNNEAAMGRLWKANDIPFLSDLGDMIGFRGLRYYTCTPLYLNGKSPTSGGSHVILGPRVLWATFPYILGSAFILIAFRNRKIFYSLAEGLTNVNTGPCIHRLAEHKLQLSQLATSLSDYLSTTANSTRQSIATYDPIGASTSTLRHMKSTLSTCLPTNRPSIDLHLWNSIKEASPGSIAELRRLLRWN